MMSVFYRIETLNKKDMTKEEKLSNALQDFKKKYPNATIADLQTFVIGWHEAVKNCFIPDISNSAEYTRGYKDGWRDCGYEKNRELRIEDNYPKNTAKITTELCPKCAPGCTSKDVYFYDKEGNKL